MMSETLKKNKFAFLSAVILLAHCVYIYLLYLQVPLNSDHANQILESADILKGNLLLRGWNLTGVSFYLSELPFYVLGTALFGVDTLAYIFAASLMVMAVSAAGAFLAAGQGSGRFGRILLYLGLTGFPTLTWLGYLRGHCAVFAFFFLLLLCVPRIMKAEDHSPVLLTAAGILTACGCMSDMQLLIIGAGPILLFCLINLFRNEPRFDRKQTDRLAITLTAGIAAGILMDALLMKLGGINKNAFLDTRKFTDLDRLGDKFLLLGKGILNVFRVDFPLSGGTFLNRIAAAAAAVILGLTIFCMVRVLYRFLTEGTGDPAAVILSFSLLLMSGICFLTDIYTSEDSARYIAYFPFAAGILICRCAMTSGYKLRPLYCGIICLAAAILFLRPVSLHRIESRQDRLAAFLEENELKNGYSDFWNASHTTVAANDRVKVRAIRIRVPVLGEPDHIEGQNWFCKSEWYTAEPAFFIVFDGREYLHVSEENVGILLGAPERVLENGEYRIWVYDRDISSEIVWD